MWKTVLALLLVMALLCTVFVACKKKTEEPQDSTTESTEDSITESTEDTSDTESSETEDDNPTQVDPNLPEGGVDPETGDITFPAIPLK